MSGTFGWIDWLVVAALFALTTWIGERMSGKQATMRDFFLGGRQLPWWAVSASVIATEISAVTFISVPFFIYKDGGSFVYLQLGLFGSVIARVIVGYVLVPAYYEREIFSPYDYMGAKLGGRVRELSTALFSIGGVLAQSSRVYLTAVVLEVLLHSEFQELERHTGVPALALAVGVLSAVAIAWTLIGGINTVVWTDALLFLIFVFGMLAALVIVLRRLDGGWSELVAAGQSAGKFRFLDFDPDPAKEFTIWTAAIANAIFSVGAYGTDQMMAQRLLCCRDPRAARKAIVASSLGLLVPVLALLVGVGLYAFYQAHPLQGAALAAYQEKGDRIFPIFLMSELPTGIKGLVLGGVFAAAISSLDSVLAALAQTSMSAVWTPLRARTHPAEGENQRARAALRSSRWLIVLWGCVLALVAIGIEPVAARYGTVLQLALAMASYTSGALIAGFALAYLNVRGAGAGYLWGAPLGVLTVFTLAWPQAQAQMVAIALVSLWALLLLLMHRPRSAREGLSLAAGVLLILLLTRHAHWSADGATKVLAWPWYAPAGGAVTFAWSWLLRR